MTADEILTCEHGEPNRNACVRCARAEVDALRRELLDVHDALHAECKKPHSLPDEIRAMRAQLAESRAAVEVLRKAMTRQRDLYEQGLNTMDGDSALEHYEREYKPALDSLPASSKAYAERVALLEKVAEAARGRDHECPEQTHGRGPCGLCRALAALDATTKEGR